MPHPNRRQPCWGHTRPNNKEVRTGIESLLWPSKHLIWGTIWQETACWILYKQRVSECHKAPTSQRWKTAKHHERERAYWHPLELESSFATMRFVSEICFLLCTKRASILKRAAFGYFSHNNEVEFCLGFIAVFKFVWLYLSKFDVNNMLTKQKKAFDPQVPRKSSNFRKIGKKLFLLPYTLDTLRH